MFIERPPQWYRAFFPGAIFRMPQGKEKPGTVYLTFDDGPIPEVTPWVLDTLARFDVKATFFMVGQNIQRNPHLLRDVVARGHKAANHTLHHIRGMGISAHQYLEDAWACEALTGNRLLRPPHGWLTPRQLSALRKEYRVVMYDLVTRDYSSRVSAEMVLNNVKRYARDGSIIVFHDSLKSFEKLKYALPASLEWLIGRNFKFNLL